MLGREFPILKRKINGQRLVYLDNAATTQKPKAVIRAISDFYENRNANINRGVYSLANETTQCYEAVRDQVARFINARDRGEIIFTSGATDGINFVATTWGQANLKKGDQILLSEMEHHSNLLPWQALAKKTGAVLKFIPVKKGELDLGSLKSLLTTRTKIVAIAYVSNVLGTINPLRTIIRAARDKNAAILIDAAQAVAHLPIDVRDLNCDFLVFSAHKMYGPMGTGVLYGKKEMLYDLVPYRFGGGMVESATLNESNFRDIPNRFEAGTPNVEGVIALGAAVKFVESVSYPVIRKNDRSLIHYLLAKLKSIPEIEIYSPKDETKIAGTLSFNLGGIHPHDLAAALDRFGVAVRAGHHCAMPLHNKMQIQASVRASFAIYNDKKDIDILLKGIEYARHLLRKQ